MGRSSDFPFFIPGTTQKAGICDFEIPPFYCDSLLSILQTVLSWSVYQHKVTDINQSNKNLIFILREHTF